MTLHIGSPHEQPVTPFRDAFAFVVQEAVFQLAAFEVNVTV